MNNGTKPVTIKDRLKQAGQKLLVGRDAERAVFRGLLTAGEPPFSVLSLYGPGGVGKTTLAREFADMANAAGAMVAFLDARGIEATPEGFERALQAVAPDFAAAREGDASRRILLIDTYETLDALDGWLRDVFLPRLSSQTAVVLSGRHPLSVAWLADPGWQPLLRTIALRNLAPDDSRAYLQRRDVPAALHQNALDFTHGHPLALSLVADVLTRPDVTAKEGLGTDVGTLRFVPEDAPDVVHALIERFIDNVPTPRHRTALEICALVRYLDESLLGCVLHDDCGADGDAVDASAPADVPLLFEWLRGLSFIEGSAQGLFPHDVAREALLADLRWRNRDAYVELHRRARDYYSQRLRGAQGQTQQRLIYDAIFLHRDSAVIRAAFTFQESQSAYPDALRPTDGKAICAMVARYEGDESARIAADWLRRQPEATVVFRDLAEPDGDPVGFFTLLTLPSDLNPAQESDPAVVAAMSSLQRSSPLRPGEVARHLRFWMARDTYQSPSPIQSLLIVHALRQFLLHSRLAFTFFACADPELWAPVLAYADILPLPDAAFAVGGKPYGVYGQDWRVLPATAWLARLFDREIAATAIAGDGNELPPAPSEASLIVLSEPEFIASVRDAWRAFHRPDGLNGNPLLRSRLVVSRAGDSATLGERSDVLRTLLRESADNLQGDPRDAKGYRALFQTYINPAPTQEQAADQLDLPFNTYRRHLGEGIAAVTARLWLMEIGTEG